MVKFTSLVGKSRTTGAGDTGEKCVRSAFFGIALQMIYGERRGRHKLIYFSLRYNCYLLRVALFGDCLIMSAPLKSVSGFTGGLGNCPTFSRWPEMTTLQSDSPSLVWTLPVPVPATLSVPFLSHVRNAFVALHSGSPFGAD